jgi:tetratricopeptide (TPR) repeat protein
LLRSGGIITKSVKFVLVLLALSSFLVAQMQSNDNCDLSVRVRANDERSIEVPIQVEVLSAEGTTIATSHVTGDEPAQLQVGTGRTYRLRVSGIGIEPVTTAYFTINALEQMHSETVYVKLANRKETTESAPASPTISVSEMNIPKKAGAEMEKGLDAYSKGDMAQATAHFEKAIAAYPQYARAFNILGVIAIKDSHRGKARELFSRSILVDDKYLPAYVNLARMDLQDQNYAESESLLEKVMALNPSMPDALAVLAGTEFANKEYDKALLDVQRIHVLANHEEFAEVHIMAGKVLAMQNHPEAAIAQFQLFLTEKPDSPQAGSVRNALASLKAGQQR